jgi:hypothetical protein
MAAKARVRARLSSNPSRAGADLIVNEGERIWQALR